MPLFTEDIQLARTAYDALEARLHSAEERSQQLEVLLEEARAAAAPHQANVALLCDRVIQLEGDKVQARLEVEKLTQPKAAVTLDRLIESMGLATAVGEASMPDRVIPSLSVTVQTYVAPGEPGVGLRFQPPELGSLGAGLSSTSFELVRVPPRAGTPAPPNLYAVLQEKQTTYTDPAWARFSDAGRIVIDIATVFANTGSWSFPCLLEAAAEIAGREKNLAAGVAQFAPQEAAAAYRSSAEALAALTSALSSKPRPVAGDLLALSSALDATTRVARLLRL